MPIGIYAGLEITGATVKEAVSNPQAQAEAVLALHERFNTSFLLTAMDLSAEAEAFGCTIRMEEEEIPTVTGRLVATCEEIEKLSVPDAGEGRTTVHLTAAGNLAAHKPNFPVLGGMIGPFSLAARLFGVSETLLLTIDDPDLLDTLLAKVTRFLKAYAKSFRDQGAAGVIMAEPAAGLLSPRALGRFSSQYVRQIVEEVQTERFTILLHNCGAKIVHLPKILEAGAEIFHFGAPMDIISALAQVDSSVILSGNLDPSSVFFAGTQEEVRQKTCFLLDQSKELQELYYFFRL